MFSSDMSAHNIKPFHQLIYLCFYLPLRRKYMAHCKYNVDCDAIYFLQKT